MNGRSKQSERVKRLAQIVAGRCKKPRFFQAGLLDFSYLFGEIFGQILLFVLGSQNVRKYLDLMEPKADAAVAKNRYTQRKQCVRQIALPKQGGYESKVNGHVEVE